MKEPFSRQSVRSLLRRVSGTTADRCIVRGGTCRFASAGCPATCWMGNLVARITAFNLEVDVKTRSRRVVP